MMHPAILLVVFLCHTITQSASNSTNPTPTENKLESGSTDIHLSYDSLKARNIVQQDDTLNHLSVLEFNTLPDFIEPNSFLEKGILFFGPSRYIDSFVYLISTTGGEISTNCKVIKSENIYEIGHLQFFLLQVEVKLQCWIITRVFETGDPQTHFPKQNITLSTETLPRTSCESSVRSMPSVRMSLSPPGSELLLTASGMEPISSHMLWTKENSSMIYLHVYYIPCIHRAASAGRKLLATSCNINLEDPDHDQHQLIHISLLNPGDIQIITEKYVKVDYCNGDCSYPVDDTSYVLVTCPNGFQHRLQISQDYRKTCPGSGIAYVGWVGTFLCRGSDRPGTFSFLIVWIIFGYLIIQAVVLLLIWTFRLINYAMGKTLMALDEELGVCPICETPYLCREKVRDHLNCARGVCAYCKKPQSVNKISIHAKVCPNYEATKLKCLQKGLDPDTKLKQFISWFEVHTYFTAFSKTMYVIILLSTFLIVISPVRGDDSGIELNSVNAEPASYEDFFYNGEPFIIPENSEVFDSSYIFEAESNLCGRTCWNGPNQCKCSTNDLQEITESMFGDELSLVRKEMELFNKREASGTPEILPEDLDPNQLSGPFNLTYMSYDPLTNTTLTHGSRKKRYIASRKFMSYSPYAIGKSTGHMEPKCTDCHIEDNAYIHLTNSRNDFYSELGLYSLEKVQTDWGVVSIDENLQPTYDSTNLDVQWETSKLEREKVIVKGTVIGKLNIGHNSGMTWTIKSKESDEKKKLILFIYDAVQEYQGTTSFVTGSRYVKKWFRGACTGDCPNKCACNSDTCHHKLFDYDRKWTCNPGWCWTMHGGCSCCAVDLEKRLPKWTIIKNDLTYIGNNLIFCLKLGSDKLHCTSSKENKKISFKGVTVTISKAYGEINHLPSQISSVFYQPTTGLVQFVQPNYYWIRDRVCDKSCRHGDVGDLATNTIVDWHDRSRIIANSTPKPIGNRFSGSQQKAGMSWNGLNIEHTCHAGSWPECDYYNLVENIDDQIKNVNLTAKHLSEEFELRYSSLVRSGLALGVLPKRMTGMIDFTIQMTDVELTRKEVKFVSETFTINKCKGCYGCSSGFECIGELVVRTKGLFNIHITSSNTLVSVDQSSRVINATKEAKVSFPIHAISLLNESKLEFCIEEDKKCASVEFKLDEPVRKLMKRETIISIKSNDDLNQSKCTGFGWISCAAGNAKTFFSNILDWFSYLYNNLNAIFWITVPLLMVVFALFISYKLYKCIKNKKELNKHKGRDPKFLLDKFKEQEKKHLDEANKPKGRFYGLLSSKDVKMSDSKV